MHVLVTGGTGFVGQNILRELSRGGHAIYILARNAGSKRATEFAKQYGAAIRDGNVLDQPSLHRACQGLDAIIHLVGIISEVGEQTFERINADGTRNIVSAAQQNAVKRFVHMSALGTRPYAVARYHRSKWIAEETVRQSGLNWTIFRPSIMYGPGDGFVNLFAQIARRSPLVPVIGDGRSKFQPVSVENVAKAFVSALTEDKSIGQTYDLAGPEVLTMNEIVTLIVAATGRKRIRVHLPLWLAYVQAALLEFVFATLLRKAPPLNRDQIQLLQEDNVGNPAPANQLFNLATLPFDASIRSYLKEHEAMDIQRHKPG